MVMLRSFVKMQANWVCSRHRHNREAVWMLLDFFVTTPSNSCATNCKPLDDFLRDTWLAVYVQHGKHRTSICVHSTRMHLATPSESSIKCGLQGCETMLLMTAKASSRMQQLDSSHEQGGFKVCKSLNIIGYT